LQPARPPRGLIMATGEDTPHGQSLQARLFVLKVAPEMVGWERMTACQQDAAAGLYAAAFAAYVRWLAPQLDAVRQEMAARLAALREQATGSGQHMRLPGIVANLFYAMELYCRFAVQNKALTQKQADALLKRCWQALGEAAAAQATVQAHGEPGRRFLDLLVAAIRTGKAHVAGPDGGPPPTPAGLGWREEASAWVAAGDRVGWTDGPALYLEPDAAYLIAQRMAQESHEALVIAPKALHKRLHEQGYLVSTDNPRGRLVVRKTLEGWVRTVLHLRADVLGGAFVPEPSPRPSGAATGRRKQR
jgi:hypothetical protein